MIVWMKKQLVYQLLQYCFRCCSHRDRKYASFIELLLSFPLVVIPTDSLNHPIFPKSKDKVYNSKSYQSILQITLTAPMVNLASFYREIREKANEKFGIPVHSKIAPVVPIRAVYLYDAVLIYGNSNESGSRRLFEEN